MNVATMSRLLSKAAALAGLGVLSACTDSMTGAGPTAGGRESAGATASAAADCSAAGELKYVCGPANAEDIVQIDDSRWLIVSGMSRDGSPAHLYLLDHETKRYDEWFPADDPIFALDRSLFADCPGPLDTTNFSAHGLSIREQTNGHYRVYMTSHGAREAIEVFDVDATASRPGISWVGCVVLPDHINANSVAILADGGFVTTKILDALDPGSRAELSAGRVSGAVYEWHPGGEVTLMEGTELSGPNGIELSADQRYLFVATIGSREVVRFDLSTTPPTKASVSVSVRPDNLRWTGDGHLLTVGGNYIPPDECQSPPCSTGWSVIEIEPLTLEARRIAGADESAALQGASTALAIGDEIWIGTFNSDRVGYLPRP